MGKTLYVDLQEHSYDIIIGNGIIDDIGSYIDNKRVFIITDDHVNDFFGERVISSIKGEVFRFVLAAGEESKSITSLQKIYGFLLQNQITRNDLVIALGGGVVGDLTGFAASTVLRGVPFAQVPTSLLAQVDSSVGGKVAINSPYGKNLIGAFYQPKLVLIDPLCLDTLSLRVINDGMAEVIKYGCISDKALFDNLLNSNPFASLEDIIYTCCDIKRKIVEKDEFDNGERIILNFGHTIGHAVENYYNYEKYTHGEAVAIGMYNISLLGEKIGVTPPGTAEKIKQVLVKYELPYELPVDMTNLMNTIALDKKSVGDKINIVLLDKLGSAVVKPMLKSDVFI